MNLTDEIKVMFLNVDHQSIRQSSTNLHATCEQPMRLMKRAVFENEFMHTGKDSFLRVRDEGDRTTMTYKQFDSSSVDGAKEIEIHVEDFDKAVAIMKQTGLFPKSIQESKREL